MKTVLAFALVLFATAVRAQSRGAAVVPLFPTCGPAIAPGELCRWPAATNATFAPDGLQRPVWLFIAASPKWGVRKETFSLALEVVPLGDECDPAVASQTEAGIGILSIDCLSPSSP